MLNYKKARQYIEDDELHHTVILLNNYKRWVIRARSFGLRELDEKLAELLDPVGSYASYSKEQRLFLEAVIYLHLFDHVNLLIDDFAALCYALSGQLQCFPSKIIKAPSPKTVFEKLDEATWMNLLRYADLTEFNLGSDDRLFVEGIRSKNVIVRQNLVHHIGNFRLTYRHLHAKYKHGNPLIYEMDELQVDGTRVIVIPVLYDSRNVNNMGVIAVTDVIYRTWQQIHIEVSEFSTDLIQRALESISRCGAGMVEHSTKFDMSPAEYKRLKTIVEHVDRSVEKIPLIGKPRFLSPPYDDIRQQIKMAEDRFDDEKGIFSQEASF